ncbi:MAG: arylsulfatase [Acidimicrobiaceae bacterium]|nr:arylsulfatase [Acidimicrobiaceae bacterium]
MIHRIYGVNSREEVAPSWPVSATPPAGSPNVLIVLFDDVGFSDFGCYGSPISTPTIDRLAKNGLQYTGFHTTAMCSTTRAALLTGRNHHSVGVGCLANFDSGYPGYRGKISPNAGTLAEILRPHGYRNYMIGKWHVTPLTESGPTGPFDGWPLGRGFDRFYGFLDAETDQYSPELIRDNSHVAPPGTFSTGYHLTEDLFDQAIQFIASHEATIPDHPWMTLIGLGACHAPHQAPKELISHYDSMFRRGWDTERSERLARQISLGIVPPETQLPPRNDFVEAWNQLDDITRQVATRLQAAYAAMLHHSDLHLARLVDHLELSGQIDNTVIMVLSDNGASQEGGPLGFVNAMGPYNGLPESMEAKFDRIDDIGGPDTHSNFPWGWAMTANTPLRRYKQNTHGGGVRDPLVVHWPRKITQPGLRDQFCHASDIVPTLLDFIKVAAPEKINGVQQKPIEGISFASTLTDRYAQTGKTTQYFEMFGHRGLVHDGWKAVAFHPPGTPYEHDQWELFNLVDDFNETKDLSAVEAVRLSEMIDLWWEQAKLHQVLPLDDRFAERFAENANRHLGGRTFFTFWKGMGHLPSDVAPDLRSRSYRLDAQVEPIKGNVSGVLIAHGDATSGYSLYLDDRGHLVHDLNIGGSHQILRSPKPVPVGTTNLGFYMSRDEQSHRGLGQLVIDGEVVATQETDNIFFLMISWSGLDIGLDRGTAVSNYEAPNCFTGDLVKVTIDLADDQLLDGHGLGRAEMMRE